METWTLTHPEWGRLTVELGYDAEFAVLGSDWPLEPGDKEITPVPGDAGLRQRLEGFAKNPPKRLQVRVDDTVVARYKAVSSGRIPLERRAWSPRMRDSLTPVDRRNPHLNIQATALDELLTVEYRDGDTVVELEPPAGSRGARRHQAMRESPLKRVLYPLAAGMGKAGWALAILVLGPMVGRLIEAIIDWLLQFVPDWEITLPTIHLPVPELPGLPTIHLPVPHIPWPDVDLPEAPGWVKLAVEYQRLWVPILVALVIGVLAVRNHGRSERRKREWSQKGWEGRRKAQSPPPGGETGRDGRP